MAWIKNIDETNADGELARAYDELRQRAGAVANILKIHSLAPDVLKSHLDIYRAALHAPGELSRAHREMIAVAVSSANGCHY